MPTAPYALPLLAAALFGVCGPLTLLAQGSPSIQLTQDTAVRMGTLPNGLKYYIRKNVEPQGRAELRLVVNAGSMQEDENQRGLAHFLEHMAFNGTEHFPKGKLVDYLESIGMGFGADINASTNFDATVYTLTIPSDSVGFVMNGLLVLHDWASALSLDSAEIDRERGVIVEEWRTRRGASMRMTDQQLPVIFGGSLYGSRLPIGLMKVVETAPRVELKRFYDEWYRPDLMAIVVVGDFDPVAMEHTVREQFGAIQARNATPRPRSVVAIAPNAIPQVAIFTDPELTSSNFSIAFRGPKLDTRTPDDYRRNLVIGFANDILSARLAEIARKPDAPFMQAGVQLSGLGRMNSSYTIGGVTKDGEIVSGLQAVLTELTRVRQFGFTQTELDRRKTNALRAIDDGELQRPKVSSTAYAGGYVGAFLNEDPIYDGSKISAVLRQLIPTITLDDVNHAIDHYVTDANRVFLVTAPKKDSVSVPTRELLLAAYDRGLHADVAAYIDSSVSDAPLLPIMPKSGTIVRERRDSATGIVDWTLSNGIRVLIKQTDFTPNIVSIAGSRPGGSSVAPDSIFIPASTASQVVGAGGVGEFSADALRKRLTGKSVRAGTAIGTYSESAGAVAPPVDLETALQLMYLSFTAPRADSVIFKTMIQNARIGLTNHSANPEAVFGDTVSVTMSQHHPRVPLTTAAVINQMDIGKSLRFYQDRFSDAGGFTFVIVGVLSPDSLKPLVERYLASLPTTSMKHKFVDLGITPPKGVVKKTVYRGQEPKSITQIVFTGPVKDTPDNRVVLSALRGILNLRLLETLRERLGGTYTPQVQAGIGDVPREMYSIGIGFGSKPDRVSELQQAVFDEINKLKTEGPLPADLQKVKEESRRERETALRSNTFWSSSMMRYAERNRPFANILTDDSYMPAVTAAQVQQAAKTFFDMSRYMVFSLLPENMIATP